MKIAITNQCKSEISTVESSNCTDFIRNFTTVYKANGILSCFIAKTLFISPFCYAAMKGAKYAIVCDDVSAMQPATGTTT